MSHFDFIISNGYKREYLKVKANNSYHAYYKAKMIVESKGWYLIN